MRLPPLLLATMAAVIGPPTSISVAQPTSSTPAAPLADDMPLADYLALLAQIAPAARDGAQAYLQAVQQRCGRSVRTAELRRAMSDGDGDPGADGHDPRKPVTGRERARPTRPARHLRPAESAVMRAAVSSVALALLCAAVGSHAIDLGTLGPTYEISEPHLLNFIEQRLREKERSGELRRLAEQAQTRGIEAVTRPTPIPGLRPTETARSFYFDPSFTLDRNIVDAQGRLLFAAGMRKNPLDVVSLSKHLLFFDARDRRQVDRARELMARYDGKVKPILTGGSYLDLMKAWHIPVYYDQQGVLTRRFGIHQVPAIVSQEGARLRIDEVVLP